MAFANSSRREKRREEALAAARTCKEQRLDSLVVIAGPKDLSWAATLATCFTEDNLCQTRALNVLKETLLYFVFRVFCLLFWETLLLRSLLKSFYLPNLSLSLFFIG